MNIKIKRLLAGIITAPLYIVFSAMLVCFCVVILPFVVIAFLGGLTEYAWTGKWGW